MSDTDPQLLTFGCRLNTYESEVMKNHARAAGLDDVIIVNTCAVTKEAERQARQAIRKARKTNPDAKIIVTGCAAQIHPESFASMDEVDRVIGNDIKLKADTWLFNPSPFAADAALPSPDGRGMSSEARQGEGKIHVGDIMNFQETASHLVEGFDGRARAFVQVQNGCDHRCTFCIIPYGRGNSRSVPIGAIVEQCRALVANGYNEIVFTGVDVTSYGPDLPGQPSLGQMIRRVLALVPELPRLRLSSLDPVEMDDDLWRLIAEEERLMPHLHMSLQAGDDMILKRMKRRHLRKDAIAMCERARSYRSDMAFGADIIAGFPTETDDMFENTLNIVEECDLTFLHVFPYSEREGTPAAKMPQVAPIIRKERAARLRDKGIVQMSKFLTKHVGMNRQIVVEQNGIGRTEHFAEVVLDKLLEPGTLHRVRTLAVKGDKLTGEVVI